ncbi:sigma-70 family RNA polymerase sigma factor [bacterium]|jgi:RNA polymerase sigma-70 factor, ECF subfamily|nr:sigma-70 family RNA polymerase sigma factor [bacterium]MBT6831931.1 sigma-70 family RNA polymerase sigma factor [bacterium]MBT6996627.1 sigma-70 family RNA polymerase sigma factor [bacterium]MBT7773047.1 sigma-70 family RNA polymerase sigma factor [bacterium]
MNREIETEVLKLVRRAQTGDESSFAKIFDLFFDKIFRYVRFRVDPEDAEDLTSEVFLKVVENIEKYKPQHKIAFSAWIFRIAHNTVVDFYRKKRELLGLVDADGNLKFDVVDDAPLPPEIAQKCWEHAQIHEMLAKLPAGHREILELKFLEDFSNAEIAKITGKSEGNIRVIQLRALREMRKFFPEK